MNENIVFDPQQELFTEAKIAVEAQGKAVYDGVLPPDGTPYPFVYLGDCQQLDAQSKSGVFCRVVLTTHVFHNNIRQRGTVSQMLGEIKAAYRQIERTAHYSWTIRGITQHIIPDKTTTAPLLHGVLSVEWELS